MNTELTLQDAYQKLSKMELSEFYPDDSFQFTTSLNTLGEIIHNGGFFDKESAIKLRKIIITFTFIYNNMMKTKAGEKLVNEIYKLEYIEYELKRVLKIWRHK